MFVKDGFLYLIVTKHKLTVHSFRLVVATSPQLIITTQCVQYSDTKSNLTLVWCLQILESNVWQKKWNMPGPRYNHAAAANGQVTVLLQWWILKRRHIKTKFGLSFIEKPFFIQSITKTFRLVVFIFVLQSRCKIRSLCGKFVESSKF